MHGVSGLLNRLLSVIIGVLFDLTQTIEFGFTSHTLFFITLLLCSGVIDMVNSDMGNSQMICMSIDMV